MWGLWSHNQGSPSTTGEQGKGITKSWIISRWLLEITRVISASFRPSRAFKVLSNPDAPTIYHAPRRRRWRSILTAPRPRVSFAFPCPPAEQDSSSWERQMAHWDPASITVGWTRSLLRINTHFLWLTLLSSHFAMPAFSPNWTCIVTVLSMPPAQPVPSFLASSPKHLTSEVPRAPLLCRRNRCSWGDLAWCALLCNALYPTLLIT